MDREVGEQERALVGAFRRRIEIVEREEAGRFRRFEEFRRYYRGVMHDDGAKGLVRTNMIFSTIATLLPQTYAKDPEISVTPSEAVEPARYKVFKKFAKTMELCLRRLYVRDAKLKVKAKAALRAAMTCQVGWVKVTFQKDIRRDPIVMNRIADIQENLQRIKALGQRLEDTSAKQDREQTQAELEAELAGLQDRVEVAVERGVVVDKLLSEHVLILDPSIRDFDDYPRASAIAQVLWFDRDTFEASFGYTPSSKAKQYHGDALGLLDSQNQIGQMGTHGWFKVYEIWDRRSMTVYTWCEGEEGWCRAPYRPDRLGQRWYPFFAIGLNKVDGQFYPMSDVELLIELQDEYNTTRTNFAEHRRKHLPIRVVRKGGSLTPEDVQRIVNAELNEIVVVSGAGGEPLSNDLAVLEHAPVDPNVYDTAPIRADIELVSGAMDAVRGAVLKAKTATEAEIMREGLMSRTAERQDMIEDWVQEQAQYVAEILLQELTIDEVVEIAGQDAIWPTLSREQVYNLVQIQVAAGSSGKPNKSREREQWAALMPIIQQSLTMITQLRATGQSDMADAMVELVRETFRRYDERLDIDSFIPPKGEARSTELPALQQQLQAAQLELQTLAEQHQALQAELAQAKQQLASRAEELEAKRVAAESERSAKMAEAEAQRALQAQLEREKLQQAERTAVRVEQVRASKELQLERLRQEAEAKRELIKQAGALLARETVQEPMQQPNPVDTLAEKMERALAAVSQAMERLAAASLAPKIPQRGPDGRITAVVSQPLTPTMQ